MHLLHPSLLSHVDYLVLRSEPTTWPSTLLRRRHMVLDWYISGSNDLYFGTAHEQTWDSTFPQNYNQIQQVLYNLLKSLTYIIIDFCDFRRWYELWYTCEIVVNLSTFRTSESHIVLGDIFEMDILNAKQLLSSLEAALNNVAAWK